VLYVEDMGYNVKICALWEDMCCTQEICGLLGRYVLYWEGMWYTG